MGTYIVTAKAKGWPDVTWSVQAYSGFDARDRVSRMMREERWSVAYRIANVKQG